MYRPTKQHGVNHNEMRTPETIKGLFEMSGMKEGMNAAPEVDVEALSHRTSDEIVADNWEIHRQRQHTVERMMDHGLNL